MKNNFKYLVVLCLLIIIILFSCKKETNKSRISETEIENITIDLDNNIQVAYDSLIERVEFIKLETTEDNLIGQISQVFFIDSLIIVVDSENAKSISVFEINGKFKNTIGEIGNGPEEFVEISNVVIVPNSNLLTVLDRPQKKILYYSLDGTFVKYERQPFMLNYFEFLDSGHKAFNTISMFDYAYGRNRGKSLIVTDSTNEIIYGAFDDTYRDDFHYVINRPLRKYGQQVFFSTNLTDSIYIVQNDKIIPKYYIDIKNNSMPNLNDKGLTTDELYNFMDTRFFYNGDFIELEDFTFVNIATPWSYPFAVYHHEKQEVFLASGKFDNPLYSFFENAPIARYKKNGIVFIVSPYILIDFKKALYENNRNYKKILDELFKDVELDSNPILFIYYLNPNLGG